MFLKIDMSSKVSTLTEENYVASNGANIEDNLVIIDDDVVLINLGILGVSDSALEQFISDHEQDIAENYIRKQQELEEIARLERQNQQLETMRAERSKKSKHNNAKILKLIILGYLRNDIMDKLQVSSTTLTKVINKLSKDYVHDMVNTYRDSVFADVPEYLMDRFAAANYSYKTLQKMIRR